VCECVLFLCGGLGVCVGGILANIFQYTYTYTRVHTYIS